MTSLIIILLFAVFSQQMAAITLMGRDQKLEISKLTQFFQQLLFLSVPSSAGFICLILCKASETSLNFRVQIRPNQLLTTI